MSHPAAAFAPESSPKKLSPSFWLGLLCVLVIACCVIDLTGRLGAIAFGAVSVIACALARVPLRLVLLRLAPLLSFAVIAFALLLLVPAGEGTAAVNVPFWGRPLPEHGVLFVQALAVKSTLIVLLVTAFASRMGERDLLEGLTGLRLPAKIVALSYLMVRSLHLVTAEIRRLGRGRDARGRAKGIRGVKVASAMTQVLMVRLGRRAETQALALASRGFAGRIALSNWRPLSPGETLLILAIGALSIWLARL